MMSSTASNPVPANAGSRQGFQEYFRKLSSTYKAQTGGSTLRAFEQFLDELDPISNDSVIHDNASGPAVAAEAVMRRVAANPSIYATDLSPPMAGAGKLIVEQNGWSNVNVEEMDARKLDFADGTFTHSILNISIQNIDDPRVGNNEDSLLVLKEMLRTLKPGGQAVITTWKRFAAGEMVREAQRHIKPDGPVMPYPHAELAEGEAVKELMKMAGFNEAHIRILEKSFEINDNADVEGLRGFMNSEMVTGPAHGGWSNGEKEQWGNAVNDTLKEEVARNGGIRFVCYAVFGRK